MTTAAQANQSLLQRMFRRSSHTPAATVPDTSSTFSGNTLVDSTPVIDRNNPPTNKPASEAEMTTFDNLMAKANTMSEADFKAYISQHRASVDAQGRGKDFIKKDAEGRYEVLPCLYNFVSRA
jgi:hypothetical protein